MPDIHIIQPEDELARGLPIIESHFKDNKPTSAVFKTKSGEDGLSVNILQLTSIAEIISSKSKEYIVAVFKASIPINEGYECKHDPQEGNFSHALILGDTKRIARKLAKNCYVSS